MGARENAGTAGLGIGSGRGFCGKLCDFGAFGGAFAVSQPVESISKKDKNINLII